MLAVAATLCLLKTRGKKLIMGARVQGHAWAEQLKMESVQPPRGYTSQNRIRIRRPVRVPVRPSPGYGACSNIASIPSPITAPSPAPIAPTRSTPPVQLLSGSPSPAVVAQPTVPRTTPLKPPATAPMIAPFLNESRCAGVDWVAGAAVTDTQLRTLCSRGDSRRAGLADRAASSAAEAIISNIPNGTPPERRRLSHFGQPRINFL